MSKTVKHFKDQLVGIRLSIPTAGLIDTIKVDYHGQATPIQILANTQAADGRIKIEVYDPTSLSAIEKALKATGFNAYIFSKTAVAVNLPKIANAGEKEKVVTQIKKLEEDAKVAIRNIRKKARQVLPEEEHKRLQDLTDQHIAHITTIAKNKVNSLA